MTDSLEAASAQVDLSLREAIVGWLGDHPGEHSCALIAVGLVAWLPDWPWAGDVQQIVANECARAHRAGHLTRSRRRDAANGQSRLRTVYGLAEK